MHWILHTTESAGNLKLIAFRLKFADSFMNIHNLKIDVVNVVHRLAHDVDVAKRQFQNMQKNFTYIKNAFLKLILDQFSHMTHQIEA